MDAADTISRVFRHFLPNQHILRFVKEPTGNINGTYRIYTADGTYMLQEISRTVFGENVPGLERNYRQFLKAYDQYGQYGRQQPVFAVPRWLPDGEGRLIYTDEAQRHWRIYRYLPGEPLSGADVPDKTELFANAVVSMHFLLSHISENLREVIDHYHEIRYYAEVFSSVQAVSRRDAECEQVIAEELPFILEHCLFEDNAVIHGDTKIGNILYDGETGQISFIDLDTFCYSSRLVDIGDSVRSIAYRRRNAGNDVSGGKEGRNENEINGGNKGSRGNDAGDRNDGSMNSGCFDWDLCKKFLKAYVSSPLCRLNQEEISRLPSALMRIPFELGLRYYTDYLMGNPYFPTSDPERNLVRAKEQFRLYHEIHQGVLDSLLPSGCYRHNLNDDYKNV